MRPRDVGQFIVLPQRGLQQALGTIQRDGDGAFVILRASSTEETDMTTSSDQGFPRWLILLGALTAQGNSDIADIQVGAALGNGELTPEELEEIVLFLCYYTGWPNGTKLGNVVGPHVARARKAARRAEGGGV